MKIFTDFHHPALLYSLHLLLEKRMGHTLYRPIGQDWIQTKTWKIIDLCQNDIQREEKLAEYLLPNGIPAYNTESWNKISSQEDGYYFLEPSGAIPCSGRGITFEQFKRTQFDLIIATFSWNVPVYKKLSQLYQNNIPVVVQVGNAWDLDQFADSYILASIKPRPSKASNIIFYKQEFNLDIFSKALPNIAQKDIVSFVDPIYILKEDGEYIANLESKLSDYSFKFYGKNNRNGFMNNIFTIAETMQKARFGLHLKFAENGYGHLIHNWMATGRPVLFRSSQHKDGLTKDILEHMVTGIDLDIVDPASCAKIINELSADKYSQICENIYLRFKETTNFDIDAEKIKSFLSKAIGN